MQSPFQTPPLLTAQQEPEDFASASRAAGALWKAGRQEEAIAAFTRITRQHPQQPNGWNNLAVALRARGRLDEAGEALQEALRLAPQLASAWYHLAEVAQAQNESAAALAHIERALALKPDHPKFAYCRARLMLDSGQWEKAEQAALHAIRLQPDNRAAMLPLGMLRLQQQRHDEAIGVFRQIVLQLPHMKAAWYNLGIACLMTRRFALAARAFRTALVLQPRDASSMCYLAHCWQELRETDRARYLLDPDRLIVTRDIAAFDGEADRAAYHARLREWVCAHPDKAWEKQGNTTVGGYHTGNLLSDGGEPIIRSLHIAIRREVDAYIAHLKATLDAHHPLIQRIPHRYRIHLWATILQEEGYQATHNHPSGWISGCYYLSVPDCVTSPQSGNSHAGWIEFGEPGYDLPYSFQPDIVSYRPHEGRIVLFPSYIFHRTVPFCSDQTRISLAFDVIADDDGNTEPHHAA